MRKNITNIEGNQHDREDRTDNAGEVWLYIVCNRPPSDPVHSCSKLETILSYVYREGKDIILLGDKKCNFASKPTGKLSDTNAK